MSYQVIEPNKDPVYLDFMKHKIGYVPLSTIKNKYKKFYKCSGLWNNGCTECTFEQLEGLVNWMATGDYYESSDGEAIFIHGFSGNDMW